MRVLGTCSWRHMRCRRIGHSGLVAMSIVVAISASCAERASAVLPDSRAYELVTQLNKNGQSVSYGYAGSPVSDPNEGNMYFAAPDGQQVMFGLVGGPEARGGQPGETYVAARTAGGWASTVLSPPANLRHPVTAIFEGNLGLAIFSDVIGGDFSRPIFQVWGAAESSPSTSSQNIYEGGPGGSLTLLSKGSLAPNGTDTGGASYAGQSADGSHILFFSRAILESQASGLVPEECCVFELYDHSGGQTHVVGLLPDGSLEANGVMLGGGGGEVGGMGNKPYKQGQVWSADHAISSDGSRIFFQNRSGAAEVYMRETNASTTTISLSQRTGSVGTPSNGASFQWASADGSKVLFSSGSQLTNDATNEGGLYEYDVETHTLSFLSPDSTDSTGARVQGHSVIAAEDGSRIYFVAQGKLEGTGLAGEGTLGQPNVYLYEAGSPTPLRFITTLAPADEWGSSAVEGVPQVRATPDGRYLAFVSSAQLTSYDNKGHAEIYRYDAQAQAEPLVCVSCDPNGPPVADASLNRLPFGAPTYLRLASSDFSPIRNISEDGSTVFFETAEPLVPQAVNGKVNVYEWHDGQLGLISDGSGPENSQLYDASANGEDVFFTTYDKLVSSDGALNVYDAHVCSAAAPCPAAAASPPPPCESAQACKAGSSSPGALLGTPMSAAFSGAGNETPPATKPVSRARKLAKALKACRSKPKKKRALCERQARKRYGAAAARSTRRGK
jgi:Tol biopolymer transport system component